MGALGRLKHAFNAFLDQDDEFRNRPFDMGASYGVRPDKFRLRVSNERSIISSIYTRISVDVAAIDIRHIKFDKDGRYTEDMDSGLNNCLNLEANVDQNARHFLQDVAMTLLDKGTIALVVVDSADNPDRSASVDIQTMRVGEVVQWYPRHVRVNLYNDQTGRREEITLKKTSVAIIENPLYSVMNEPNSTLQRLIRKLNLLDAVDEQASSGKLDMLIQLPYVVKTESKRQMAEKRRKDIEFQLKGSQYGIAYVDGTEKVTQLNRPAENNLLKTVEYLTEMLYGQLGITAEVMNGTADEKAMLNYINRTLEPILAAIALELKRKFLSKTARSQGQSVEYFRDPFKLVPMSELAELVDKLTRNEIMSSNEVRSFIGLKPSKDPKADQLRNSNMPDDRLLPPATLPPSDDGEEEVFAGVNQKLDEVFAELGEPANAGT
jgi:hypothetical protein